MVVSENAAKPPDSAAHPSHAPGSLFAGPLLLGGTFLCPNGSRLGAAVFRAGGEATDFYLQPSSLHFAFQTSVFQEDPCVKMIPGPQSLRLLSFPGHDPQSQPFKNVVCSLLDYVTHLKEKQTYMG